MSKIKPKRAFASEHFDSFDGLGSQRQKNRHHASSIINFRITADGSLKKRGGYSRFCAYPKKIRAFWRGQINQMNYQFAVCDTEVYVSDVDSGTPIVIDTVSSSTGEISFWRYGDELYLLDGGQIRVFSPTLRKFEAVTPYVPLYGRNWDPTNRGSMYESFNQLTTHIRVTYENPNNATVFNLPFACKRIVGVRVNAREVTDYTHQSYGSTVTIPASSTGYIVEIAMEPVISLLDEDLRSARRALTVTAQNQNTPILYATDAGDRLYPASPITQHELYSCRVLYPNAKPLYFKEKNILQIGDSEHPLYSLCRYGDRILAYSGLGTWMLSCTDDAPDRYIPTPLPGSTTSTAPKTAITVKGTPVVVNNGGIFLMEIPRNDTDQPQIEKISDPVEDYLSPSFSENSIAWENKQFSEIWFRDPTQESSPVLVYQYLLKQWYLFDNICATDFIDQPIGTLFVAGDTVEQINDALTTDNGEEIIASYQSGYFSFSHPEAQKRALRMVACAKVRPEEGGCYLHLESENAQASFSLQGAGEDAPDYFDRRVLFGRFRFLRFRILMGGEGADEIHSISFYANL